MKNDSAIPGDPKRGRPKNIQSHFNLSVSTTVKMFTG